MITMLKFCDYVYYVNALFVIMLSTEEILMILGEPNASSNLFVFARLFFTWFGSVLFFVVSFKKKKEFEWQFYS